MIDNRRPKPSQPRLAREGRSTALGTAIGERPQRNGDTDALGCTPLYYAARGGHANVIHVLVARGADVDLASPTLGPPLIRAAQTSTPTPSPACWPRAPISTRATPPGNTALSYAIMTGDARTERLLQRATTGRRHPQALTPGR